MRHASFGALAVTLATVVSVAAWVFAQDRKAVDPSMKILFENDRVRVQEHYVKRGERIGMHSHPPYVVYSFNDYKVRSTFPDGSSRESAGKAGHAHWNEATTHAVENIGTTDVRNLVIEIKEQVAR